MAVGQGSYFSGESYLGIGRETTYGTAATATASLDFLSASIKTSQDSKLLEQVERKRGNTKVFRMGKTVEGDVEFLFQPELTACAYILQQAFGGTVTSATATGETTGGGSLTHTFEVGTMENTYKSFTFNMRKGGTAGALQVEYFGGRINSLSIAGEIDEPVKCTASMIFKDSTQSSNDIESALTTTADECLSFASGRLSVESSLAALTSTSFWHVQSINYTMNNNLKNDTSSRRIGSDTLDVLPIGQLTQELSVSMRFDTTTAYDDMLANTQLAGEFEFLGSTISGSTQPIGLKYRFPKLYIKDAGDPEIGGPDESLVATVTFEIARDDSSGTGYAVQAELTRTGAF